MRTRGDILRLLSQGVGFHAQFFRWYVGAYVRPWPRMTQFHYGKGRDREERNLFKFTFFVRPRDLWGRLPVGYKDGYVK